MPFQIETEPQAPLVSLPSMESDTLIAASITPNIDVNLDATTCVADVKSVGQQGDILLGKTMAMLGI